MIQHNIGYRQVVIIFLHSDFQFSRRLELKIIGDSMRFPLVSVSSQETVAGAIRSFHISKVGALLVKASGRYVGILVKSNLVRRIRRGDLDPHTKLIYEVMEQPIPCLEHDKSLHEANQFMCYHNLRYLAVTEGNKVIGIFSAEDLIADFMDRYL